MRRNLALFCALSTVLLAAQAPAEASSTGTKGLRYPSLTPDNKHVVFGYRGDLWIAPVDGQSSVRRLTIHDRQETLARVSPDGKHVAFSSMRNGNYDIYIMPIAGGIPKQVTFHSGFEALCDWHPSGKKLLYTSAQDGDKGRFDLYEVSLNGGTPKRMTFDGGRDGNYSPDGNSIVYSRGFNSIYWDNYKGSANYDIYVVDTKGGLPKRVHKSEGNERYPCFSKDGKSIFFVAEDKGVANFYSIPAAGGKVTQLTQYKGSDVHRPDLNWDHKTVVFERAGQLHWTDLSSDKPESKAIDIKIQTDSRNSGIETRTITGGGEQVCVSNDGRYLAFTLRGDIWLMPAAGGKGRQLTKGPDNDQWPRFSPDGSKIAYFSNKNKNNDIFMLDLKTGKTEQITKSDKNDHFHNWSPDGKSLVFCSERSGNRDIWIIDLESKQKTQVTRHKAGDDDPSFSPDGQYIAFDSARAGTQAIYICRKDGSDVRRVTPQSGFLQVPNFSPDGKHLVYEEFSPTNGQSGGLFVISVNGGTSMKISRDGQTACWSARGDYIYFTANRGTSGNGVFRVPAPKSVIAGEHVPFIGTVNVDLKKELANLFDECWNALGNGFYDPKMHGVDWKEMRAKYREMAIDAECKDEFHNVIRQMLAELGASHLGIYGGTKRGNSANPTVKATGYLGLEFEQHSRGPLKVQKVLAGGPADQAGIRVGDVVSAFGRVPASPNMNLNKVLAGTVGKEISVIYQPRSEQGLGSRRQAKIKPISFGQMRALKSRNWERTCISRTFQATRGQIGYIHLSAMNPQNLAKFQQYVARMNRNPRCRGLIIDVRFNGGGNIHNQLMSILISKPLARVKIRGRTTAMQPSLYWDKPVVCLINERSFSDAEVFPYMFRKAGVGKLIGVPTAGGVIGTNDITLSDGTRFRIPRVGFFGMDGTNLEGLGVKPDFLVEETPEDRRKGNDPQLKKAIQVVINEIRNQGRPPRVDASKKEPGKTSDSKPKPKKGLYKAKPESALERLARGQSTAPSAE